MSGEASSLSFSIDVTFSESKAQEVLRSIELAWRHCSHDGKKHFGPLHQLAATLRAELAGPEPPKEAA